MKYRIMKRTLSILLAVFASAALLSCDEVSIVEIPEPQNEEDKKPGDNNQNNGNDNGTVDMLTPTSKTLVVYYSYTGDCREIVSTLTEKIEADVLEIRPSEEGLKYEANNYALGTQLLNAIKAKPNDDASYPGIKPVNRDASAYDTIFIVTPLWWSQMSAIMQSYLFRGSTKFSGKTVAMIVSSHSSGISGVVGDANRLLPDVTWAGDALHISNANRQSRGSLMDDWLKALNINSSSDKTRKLHLTIGGVTKSATLVSNSSTEALVAQLQKGDINYEAHDYGDFEKVGPLGYTFPENNTQITTEPGDLILYQGSNLCIYYDTNSWNFTHIGKLDNMTQADIKAWVKAGEGNVNVTLSLKQ